MITLPGSLVIAALAAAPAPPGLTATVEAALARAGGRAGVVITHVDSGAQTRVGAATRLPLYSVVKLPIAIAALAEVGAGRLALDRQVDVTAADVSRGQAQSLARWQDVPKRVPVKALLELSLIESDNTASDRLLALLGGAKTAAARFRKLGMEGIDLDPVYPSKRSGPESNLGTAAALDRLLGRIGKGELLRAPERELLLELMRRSPTGARRLRGKLPPGTPVADKTGTGGDGASVNDVGLVTLPDGRGQLAITVLLADAKLPRAQQEDVIADIARAAYDAFTRK